MSKPSSRSFGLKTDKLDEVKLEHRYVQCVPGIGKERDGEFAGARVMYAPNPLPCTVIFVHGVNSEGEWYNAAEANLCEGLNDRLGRHRTSVALRPTIDPEARSGPYRYSVDRPLQSNRPGFDPKANPEADNFVTSTSPVIRFYWGYKAAKGDHLKEAHRDLGRPAQTGAAHRRQYPVSLDEDDCWGGGPFQNGTPNLWAMFRSDKGFSSDLQRINPVTDRFLTEAPPRTYYVHAARRLAYLVQTIRKNSPQETINIVSHSQGTMVAMLATLVLQEQGVRGPEALFVCNSPFSLNAPASLETVQFGDEHAKRRSICMRRNPRQVGPQRASRLRSAL